MLDRSSRERSRAVTLERHIVEGADRLACFRSLIQDTARRGGDTHNAERLLASMEGTHQTLRDLHTDAMSRARAAERRSRQDDRRPQRELAARRPDPDGSMPKK